MAGFGAGAGAGADGSAIPAAARTGAGFATRVVRFRGGATAFWVGTTRRSHTGHTVAPGCNSAPQFVHCMAQVPLGRPWRGVP
jgi:hypothetical protein